MEYNNEDFIVAVAWLTLGCGVLNLIAITVLVLSVFSK